MKNRVCVFIVGLICLLPILLSGQITVKKQPASLLNAGTKVEVNQVISLQKEKFPLRAKVPWTVYSNRTDRSKNLDFGKKYFVFDENETQFLVCSGEALEGLTIQKAEKRQWLSKSDFLYHFSAEFTDKALIHKKCVVLNSKELIDSICLGLIDEMKIKVFHSPIDTTVSEFLPLYSTYFIYGHENGRYLLGRDYGMENINPDSASAFKINAKIDKFFTKQIIGWVDTIRVFRWDNRLGFEPDFNNKSVKQRRLDNEFGNAKVFNSAEGLKLFLRNEAVVEPLWEEPDYFHLNNILAKEVISGRIDKYSLQKELRDINGIDFITNRPASQKYFRFPFLGVTKNDRNIFHVSATGKYVLSTKTICDSIRTSIYNANVSFILPESLPNYIAAFLLVELDTNYQKFKKQYAACYYPGDITKSKTQENTYWNRYPEMISKVKNHIQQRNELFNNDCFDVLKNIFDKYKFNEQQLNIIVLVNTSTKNYNNDGQIKYFSKKIRENNCSIMAFDFVNNPSFTSMVEKTIIAAADGFNKSDKPANEPGKWLKAGNNGEFKVFRNGLLSTVCSIDSNQLKSFPIMSFIKSSYDQIILFVDSVVSKKCSMDYNNDSIELTKEESKYWHTLEKILLEKRKNKGNEFRCVKNISSMRIMEMGYTSLRWPNNDTIWQAEVLMNRDELDYLTQVIDNFTRGNTTINQCNLIFSLWQNIVRRFLGEDIILNKSYLNKTMDLLLQEMIGSRFGYKSEEMIKKYTLQQIKNCNVELTKPANDYIISLSRKNMELRNLLQQEPYKIEREKNKSTNIEYYWVPIGWLP